MKRHLRLEFKFPEHDVINDEPLLGPESRLPPFTVPNMVTFRGDEPRLALLGVGQCIYCYATEFEPGTGIPLSEEHIISEGLGSRLVLPEASCKSCSEKTKRIEGAVLGNLLWAPRVALKIRRKKRPRSEEDFPLTAIVNGAPVTIRLPIEHHPTMLFLPVLNAPGVAINRSTDEAGIQGAWAIELNSFSKATQNGIRHFATPNLDTVRFCQLLAKTAHGYAVSVFGIGGFNHALTNFIKEPYDDLSKKCETRFYFVGGDPTDHEPSDELHLIGWGAYVQREITYLAVAIRLFAELGAPVYHVVVGSPTSKLRLEPLPFQATSF
jgi:hypothetical protein